jgi:hypothetical protein
VWAAWIEGCRPEKEGKGEGENYVDSSSTVSMSDLGGEESENDRKTNTGNFRQEREAKTDVRCLLRRAEGLVNIHVHVLTIEVQKYRNQIERW